MFLSALPMIWPPIAMNLPKLLTTYPSFLCDELNLMPFKRVETPPMCWMTNRTKKTPPMLDLDYLL